MSPLARRLSSPFLTVLALVVLVETWIWSRLGPVVARVIAALPLERLKAAIHLAVEKLPPYATLGVFLVPVVLLIPLKLAALSLLGHGGFLVGILFFGAVKVLGVALEAWLFEICKPKLMTIPAFVRVHDAWERWVHWAHGLVDPVKARIRARLAALRAAGKPGALAVIARFRDRARGRAGR